MVRQAGDLAGRQRSVIRNLAHNVLGVMISNVTIQLRTHSQARRFTCRDEALAKAERITFFYFPSYAFCSVGMSILSICSIARMTRFAFAASLSASISINTVGTTCHDKPNLSLSQPHRLSSPPTESFVQK